MIAPPCFLEAASLDDLSALLAIERESYSHPWTERHFRQEMSGADIVLVLRTPFDPQDAGRGLLAYCVSRVVANEIHVYNLAVRPDQRGRRLGRLMLELTLAVGKNRGARTAYLEVRESNRAARRLYATMGFALLSVRSQYYDQPREDALVLKKTVC